MIERIPHYYRKFSCLAGACPDSCCQEWEVDIDPATAKLYRELPGALGDSLREKMRWEDDTVYLTISDCRCPMWRQDGLCEIQCQLGHDALSHTCRQFPRLTHDYGDFVERGLELSCPAAAKLILSGENQELAENFLPGEETGDYDREVMEILLKSREILLSFWEEVPYPLPQMLAITLLYAHDIQSWIDGGDIAEFSPDALWLRAKDLALPGDTDAILAFFRELDILTPRWKMRLSTPFPAPWCEKTKYFVRYALLRYYLQAVSDYDLICRVKWIVIACLLLKNLGGDFESTAQLFSKEIENSSENMDAIFDGAYTSPAFTDRALLGLLSE
jgi:lysine-N-methylase